MENRIISNRRLASFRARLYEEERSAATVEKYLREVRQLAAWLDGAEVSRAAVIRWKEHLLREGREPSTVNGKLTAANRFFTFAGWSDCRVSHLKLQRRLFRDDSREMTREEYLRLISAAAGMGRERLSLLMEAICGTGIRVSEVRKIGRGGIFLTSDTIAIFCPGSKLVLPSGGRKPGPTTIPLCRPALVIPESKFNRRRRGPFCAPVAPRPPWRRGESACAAWG